jgi:DnaK suppressor protein
VDPAHVAGNQRNGGLDVAIQTGNRNEARWLERLERNRRQRDELAQQVTLAPGNAGEMSSAEPLDSAEVLRRQFTNQAMLRVLDDNQRQMERALERLREGRYGACEDCGATIPAQRLQLSPEATRCVVCQRRAEGLPPPC